MSNHVLLSEINFLPLRTKPSNSVRWTHPKNKSNFYKISKETYDMWAKNICRKILNNE